MSLSETLVSQIQAREITDEDLHQAALLLLDALASAYAGSQTEVGKKLLGWAVSNGDSARTKALLLGSLTHITETDDLHRASVTHPGCVVVPTILALANQHGFSDRAVLEALIKGFEAVCRVGMSVGPEHYRVWHNTATCGPFGSAMAAADLLDLDQAQTVDALGNAGTQSSGLWEFLESGAMSKHIHAGRGSEAGLLAAELAQHGITGAQTILEGEKGFYAGLCPDPEPLKLAIKPNEDWQIHQTSIKPWPSCRHTHPTIDASLEIQSQLGNSVPSSITVETYQSALALCDRESAVNEYQAKFSLQHCSAIALSRGQVDLGSFDQTARDEVSGLCSKVTVSCEEPYRSNYPKSWGAKVTVETEDNRVLTAQRTDCKGDPELRLSDEEMIAKAMGLLQFSGLDQAQATAVCDSVMAMPKSTGHTSLYPDFSVSVA